MMIARSLLLSSVMLCLTASILKADFEPHLTYSGTITKRDDTVVKGIFRCYNIYIHRLDSSTFYYVDGATTMFVKLLPDSIQGLYRVQPNQHHISNHINRNIVNTDPLAVYQDAVMISDAPVFLGKSITLKLAEIAEVSLDFVHFGGYSQTPARYTLDDKAWLSKSVFEYQELAQADMCSFNAYSYLFTSEELKSELSQIQRLIPQLDTSKLPEATTQIWNNIAIECERLRKLRILITYFCSC